MKSKMALVATTFAALTGCATTATEFAELEASCATATTYATYSECVSSNIFPLLPESIYKDYALSTASALPELIAKGTRQEAEAISDLEFFTKMAFPPPPDIGAIGRGLSGMGSAILQGAPVTNSGTTGGIFEQSYVSGANRICLYRALSGQVAITIPSLQLCPLSLP